MLDYVIYYFFMIVNVYVCVKSFAWIHKQAVFLTTPMGGARIGCEMYQNVMRRDSSSVTSAFDMNVFSRHKCLFLNANPTDRAFLLKRKNQGSCNTEFTACESIHFCACASV